MATNAAASPRLPTFLFALLIAASVAVTAVVVHAKTPDLMVEIVKLPSSVHNPVTGDRERHGFSPNGDGVRDIARMVMFVRDDEPHATVEIINASDETVRTLAADVPLRADQKRAFRWDGTTDGGGPARAGSYRVRVVLPDLDREAVDPRRIVLLRR